MVLHLRTLVEHVRHRRRMPRLPSPVDGNSVPLVQPMVGAFGVVCGVNSLVIPVIHRLLFQGALSGIMLHWVFV
jgi:hypothetical protein